MVETLVRGLRGWPKEDKRAVALSLVKQLDLSDLAEVLAAAHHRIHAEAEKRTKVSRKDTKQPQRHAK